MRKGLSIIVGIAILLFAYSASAGVHMDGLVSWWKFDETNGTTAADAAGSATNNGTLINFGGSPTWTTNTAGSASSGALYFNSSNTNYVDCTTNSSLNIPGAITLEAWIKLDPIVGEYQQRIIDRDKENGYYLRSTAHATLLGYPQLRHNNQYVAASSLIETGEWYHLAVTSDGIDTRILYINGASNAVHTAAETPGGADTTRLVIGAHDGTDYFFSGIIDDVRIYNKALTPEQILGNYNAIPEPSTSLFLGAGLLGLLALRRRRR